MPTATKRPARNARPTVTTPATTPAPSPAGIAWHHLQSDGGNAVELEMDIPTTDRPTEPLYVSFSWYDRDLRQSPRQRFDIPSDAIDSLLRNLSDVAALARHYGWLP